MSEAEHRLAQLEELRNQGLGRHQQDLQRLKAEFSSLSKLVDISPEFAIAQLMDIVKEAERKRLSEVKAAERMEKQAEASRQKAEGLSMVSSIVFSVVNRYIEGARKDLEEQMRLKAEEEETERVEGAVETVAEEATKEPPKKVRKLSIKKKGKKA